MRWLKRKLLQWLRDAHADSGNEVIRESSYPVAKSNTISGGAMNSEPTFNFTVYNAVGGKVVEFRRYDRRTDRSDHTIYVIGSDQDFGERISKIATMESLKG